MKNKTLRIGAVSYLNTVPFCYGIKKTIPKEEYKLRLEVPSLLPKLLENDEIDVGLVPVASLAKMEKYHIVSDYCLGASGKVKSVLLLSNSPISEIETIFLDRDSQTSVNLTRILAKHHWKISPKWKEQKVEPNFVLQEKEAIVAIGDKTFPLINRFKYEYDLATIWKTFTGLPFVFACWVSKNELTNQQISNLNKACSFGINHIKEAIKDNAQMIITTEEANSYLENNMDFHLDKEKKNALNYFLSFSDLFDSNISDSSSATLSERASLE